MLKTKMVISFLLAPGRSSLGRTNALPLRAREKDIWSGKAQRSIRKKRIVKGDDTGQQGSDHPKEDIEMISRRTTLLNILVLGSVLGAGLPAFGEARRPSTIQKFDTDNDGTLDLNEVKKAGGALFDKLDRDHDGTLDKRELRGRLSAKEFAAADPDKDGTLTKDEYLAVVEQRFKAADPDNDGTLDAKKLSTRAGRALLRLLQ